MTTVPLTRRLRFAASASVLALALAACQTTGQFERELGVQPVAADDGCGMHSQSLREAKGYFERDIIGGAVAGSLVGALIGGIASGGDASGFVRGALAGAATGGALGYYKARRQQAQDQAGLTGTIYADMQTESAEISRALVSFKRARDCRLREAERIKAAYRAGDLTAERARAMLEAERTRFADDVTVARAIGAEIGARQEQFNAATQQIAARSPDAHRLYTQAAIAAQGAAPTPGLKPAGVPASVAEASGDPARAGNAAAVGLNNGITDQPGRLGDLVESVPDDADTETKAVASLYEGVEKRIELERVTEAAAAEEQTAFNLQT